jgi:ammonium transporter, Amt family
MHFAKEQFSSGDVLVDLIYTLGTAAVILVVLALGFIDTGLVRRKNVLDTWITKLIASLIAGAATFAFGYGVWNWQYDQAFGVPHPLWQAIKDWWVGGVYQTHFAGAINPHVLPQADLQQVFIIYFMTFSMVAIALIHTGAMERMKPLPLYTMAILIGLVFEPLASYLCWGSVSPLTNHGTHDFDGIYALYIFAGTWVLLLSWRLKPRLGAFDPHPSGTGLAAQNIGSVGAGVLLVMFALPFIALSSGWVLPGQGYFGISFTTSGWGIVLVNVFASYAGGAISGAIIAYRRREANWALLGPIGGVVICGTMFDVGRPWYIFLIAMLGPPVALGTAALVRRLRIDEPKVVPLALGPGIVGAVLCGFVQWGTKTGGYPGLTGQYAFQHATITPWWQLIGVGAILLVAGVPCLLICFFFEKTSGLRVTEEQELVGLDHTYWGVTNFGDETLPATDSSLNGGSTDRPATTLPEPV